MGDVLNIRLQLGGEKGFTNHKPGDPVPDGVSDEDLAYMRATGAIVDEDEFVDDGEQTWAVERISTPGNIHYAQGLAPAQPGDTETPAWNDAAVANEPTTVVLGEEPRASETSAAASSSADTADTSAGVAAVQAAFGAQTETTPDETQGGE